MLSQLVEAAKTGKLAEVDRLIKSGVSKEGKNMVCCTHCFSCVCDSHHLTLERAYTACIVRGVIMRLNDSAGAVCAGGMDAADHCRGLRSCRLRAAAAELGRRQECANKCA
jgi:hypothetical protein